MNHEKYIRGILSWLEREATIEYNLFSVDHKKYLEVIATGSEKIGEEEEEEEWLGNLNIWVLGFEKYGVTVRKKRETLSGGRGISCLHHTFPRRVLQSFKCDFIF